MSSPTASSITWFKNEIKIIPTENIEIVNNEQSSILRLINCQSSDSGSSYQVKIINALGEVLSNKATLIINRGPVFELEPTDQKVLKDKEAKFECVIKANPKPNVIWLMNGKEITSKDGIRVEKDVNKDIYSIVIPKVTTVGSYIVRATNEFGLLEKSVQLEVLESPKALNKLENVTVNEGEEAKFVVKVSGKPKPQVKWFKDEEEIETNEEYEIIETSEDEVSFIIKKCKSPDNNGNYYAKISNEFGETVTNKSNLSIKS